MDRENMMIAVQAIRAQIEKLRAAEKHLLDNLPEPTVEELNDANFASLNRRKRNPKGEGKRIISELLAEAGKPLLLREIIGRLKHRPQSNIPPSSVRSTLSRHKDIFEPLEDGRWKLKSS